MEYMATLELITEKIDELAIVMARGFSELREEMHIEFERLDGRIDSVENRLDRMEKRLDGVERKLDTRIDMLQEQTDGHSTRIKDLEVTVLKSA